MITIAIILIILLSASWMYLNRDGSAWRYLNGDGSVEVEDVTDYVLQGDDGTVSEYVADIYVNVEDDAVMKKGRLLKKEFENEYNKLPDTLYVLEYGDYLYTNYQEHTKSDFWFSLVENNSLDALNTYDGKQKQEDLIAYLKLVSKEAVSPPKHECLNCGSLVDLDEFVGYYRDEFLSFGMSNLPIKLKKKIIEFYNSREGENIRYVENGNQTSVDLIWIGNLTGSGKNEYAILFKDTEYELSDNYLLLVYAANETDYYLVYSEKFYDKVLLEHLKTSSDGEENIRKIYMNTDYLVETDHDGVVIKQINKADKVLVYNVEFDKMVGYYQRSASEIKKEQEEFNEEDAEEVDDI
ncbi:hypothetical protein [Mariniflexile sp. HMF6888]|uniref:hypothetical protein n=1 Tax=Mariniflexile sp. HMF6888 TaxID=3373086 RepID=UPI00378CD4A0